MRSRRPPPREPRPASLGSRARSRSFRRSSATRSWASTSERTTSGAGSTTTATLEAGSIGGALRYRSGWLLDRLQIGATFFTSQKLYGPNDRDGTLLLLPRQRSYNVVGESFVRLRAAGNELTAYRHRFDVPYVNGNDNRMTPNTFEGLTLIGRHERVGYAVGHLLQIKRRNDDHFVSFSESAGVPGASSNGLSFAGVRIKPLENLSLGAINPLRQGHAEHRVHGDGVAPREQRRLGASAGIAVHAPAQRRRRSPDGGELQDVGAGAERSPRAGRRPC